MVFHQIVSEKECAVSREYEDFEFLHHCLVTSATSNGIIVSINVHATLSCKNIGIFWCCFFHQQSQ